MEAAFAWYAAHSASLGLDFLRAVDTCFDTITAHPLGFPVVYREIPGIPRYDAWITSSSASPYFAAFAGPIPYTPSSARIDRGRNSAISRSVRSLAMT